MLALPDKSKTKEIIERRNNVNKLLLKGATQDEIARNLKVSISTVERDVHSLKEMSSVWLDELAKSGMVHEWKINLDKLRDTERNLNQLLQDANLPRDDRLRILKQRDENIALQTQFLMDGPALHAIKKHMGDATGNYGELSE